MGNDTPETKLLNNSSNSFKRNISVSRALKQPSVPNSQYSGVRFSETRTRSSLSCGQKLQKFFSLTVAFILDVGIIFLDWFLDFITGLTHFRDGNVAYGVLTWCLPILAGIICSIRLPNLLKTRKDEVSKFCIFLSKVPSLQPIVFSYRLFQTKVKDYPGNPANAEYLAHLILVSNHLKILEGIFEAAPQAMLQIYICFWEYESTGSNIKVLFTVFKVVMSLLSMTEVFVKYWLQNMPYIFTPETGNQNFGNTQYCDLIVKYSKKLLMVLIYPLYAAEAFTLACLRAITIVFALLLLPDTMASRLHIYFPEPKILIPILAIVLILIVPRLVFTAAAYVRCLLSSKLKEELLYHQSYCGIRISDLRFEYFVQFLKRGMFSIFVYPIYPCHPLLILYGNLETVLVLAYVYVHGLPVGVYQPSDYLIFSILVVHYAAILTRLLHQKFYLGNTKNGHLVAQQFSKRFENIIVQLYTGEKKDFSEIKNLLLDLEKFFVENILKTEFEGTTGDDLFAALSFKWNSFQPKIGETGNCLVYRHINLWDLPNYCLYKILVHYCKTYNHILLEGSRPSSPWVNEDRGEQQELKLILDTVKPLARILVYISLESTNHFQHFTNFEFPVGAEKLGISEVTYDELRCFIRLITSTQSTLGKSMSFDHNFGVQVEEASAWPPALEIELIPFIDDI